MNCEQTLANPLFIVLSADFILNFAIYIYLHPSYQIACNSRHLDTILSLALFEILELKIHTLIKKELFKGPLKTILEKLGGIPVDRKASKDIVTQMVELFNQNDRFNLVIAPEATRAKDGEERKPIRTGFWHIAKAANVPIILMYANAKTRQGGILGKIYPTDLQQDLEKIKTLYAEYGIDVKIQ